MDRVIKPLVMGVTAIALIVAFGYLLYLGGSLIAGSDDLGLRGLGAGLVLLTLVGVWATWAILRNGLELQRISAAAAAAGVELDVSELDRMPSGRLDRGAADALFDEVSAEYQAAPGDWRTTYRLARAYDHAGDRARGREMMREAVRLHDAEAAAARKGTP